MKYIQMRSKKTVYGNVFFTFSYMNNSHRKEGKKISNWNVNYHLENLTLINKHPKMKEGGMRGVGKKWLLDILQKRFSFKTSLTDWLSVFEKAAIEFQKKKKKSSTFFTIWIKQIQYIFFFLKQISIKLRNRIFFYS